MAGTAGASFASTGADTSDRPRTAVVRIGTKAGEAFMKSNPDVEIKHGFSSKVKKMQRRSHILYHRINIVCPVMR